MCGPSEDCTPNIDSVEKSVEISILLQSPIGSHGTICSTGHN